MVNLICAFSQSELGKYFEWIISTVNPLLIRISSWHVSLFSKICRHFTPCNAGNLGLRPSPSPSPTYYLELFLALGGGILNKCLYKSNPLVIPLYIPFFSEKGTSDDKWYPFHILCLELRISYNWGISSKVVVGRSRVLARIVSLAQIGELACRPGLASPYRPS